MKTILLDRTTWDLLLDAQGNIAVADDPYSLSQDVASACRTFLGECYYDTSLGVPYWPDILGHDPPVSLVQQWFIDAAETQDGVEDAIAVVAIGADRRITGQIQFGDGNIASIG